MIAQGIPQNSKLSVRPAPVKGINAYDALGFMPEGFALTLRNLYAQPYGCQVRRGFVRHASGLIGDVETIMSHNTDSPVLYAVAYDGSQASIYDVTAPNTVNPTPIDSGYINARFQHINFPNPAGVNLIAVNGADDLVWIKPDGTIVNVTAGDGMGDTIKNADPTTFIHVYSHQKRLWFVEKDSTRAWYMPPDQITGDATMFDFGPLWVRGGYLMQIITWTLDDGNGADDHLAAISSQGEVAIYQGLDPSNADSWTLQGVYFAGAPVGRRAATRYGGDIIILTQFGVVQLSNLLKSTKVNPTEGDQSKYIQQLVSNAASLHFGQFGWQPFVFPAANMVMVNVPTTDTQRFQFAMNDITKAWSEFLGYEANCWELHNELPFYGSLGAVYRAWEQNTDDAVIAADGKVTLGSEIRWEAQTTFSFFDEGPYQKQFHLVRPVIVSQGQFRLSYAVNVNYSFGGASYPAAFTAYQPGVWDEGLWDDAVWAGGLRTFMGWLGAEGIGVNASLRLLGTSASETYWASTDWVYEKGGIL